MSRLLIWVVFIAVGYWNIFNGVEGVQKAGYVAFCVSFSLISLFSIKWLFFLKSKRNNKTIWVGDNVLSTVFSFVMPLGLLFGFEYWTYKSFFLGIFSGIIFIFEGQLEWFWRNRWGDLKLMSDSGNVRDDEYIRIKNVVFGLIFIPVPMFYFVGLIWGR